MVHCRNIPPERTKLYHATELAGDEVGFLYALLEDFQTRLEAEPKNIFTNCARENTAALMRKMAAR